MQNPKQLPRGPKYPEVFNVIIEIPQHSIGVKYEYESSLGLIVAERFMPTPMHYPANYGFIPDTIAGDNDPVDVLLISPYPLQPGCLIEARPAGILMMEDEGGKDEKIIAYPASSVTKMYDNIQDITDVPQLIKNQIKHFFENYKKLEPNKFVKVEEYKNKNEAIAYLKQAQGA